MTVGELVPRLSGVEASGGGVSVVAPEVLNRAVTAIAYDSREVIPGAVFVAVRGQNHDGSRFASDSMSRGAVLVVSAASPLDVDGGAWLKVADARLALAELSSAFYGDPSHELAVVGVTGTNGKTTTTYLLSSIFESAGWPCGRVGSVGSQTGGREEVAVSARTTPEAPEVQALLHEMVEHGCLACVMEVSSHALAMRRVDETRFAAGVFSNLTRDHLDYHSSMDRYFNAKKRLFEMLPDDAPAVINIDDPFGRRLVNTVARPVTYGLSEAADVTPDRIESTPAGTVLDVRTSRGRLQVKLSLHGRMNAYNGLAAVATAVALDVPFQAIEQGVAALEGVPGRFEVVSASNDDVWVVVDFAHTEDALRALLGAVRELGHGRLITVFGCGGDRDRDKRQTMGATAARFSDLVILTADNPRSEDPADIITEIRLGLVAAERSSAGLEHIAIPDRESAIEQAIAQAVPGDAVVIAGKGHEVEQQVGDERFPFDDRAAARAALERRRARVRQLQRP